MSVRVLERVIFRHRLAILALFALVTIVTAVFAAQLRLAAGFDKQLPAGHPYIETFQEYRDRLFGSNRIIVVLKARDGDIWSQDFLAKLKQVTDDLFFLPGIDRRTVTSLWTPNTRMFEITEEGFRADDVIPGTITPDRIDADAIERIQNNVIRGGYVGRLVSNDFTSAMIVAELQEIDPATRKPLDYFDLADQLETKIRAPHETERFDVQIIGFAKLVGDIADGAGSVVKFFAIAFLVTAALVYWYSRSILLTVLPLVCSLTSLIWQFGLLTVLGYGLDPLAILVPFLVFAIGVSHGVQQINLISKEVEAGSSADKAARASFSSLLVPGSMALVTDLVGFGTLYFINIPMIRELAITASIGVALKILTNLVMLPILASYCRFDERFIKRVTRARAVRSRIMAGLGRIAEPRYALLAFFAAMGLFAVSLWQSQGRHIGDLHAGAPELRTDARYNADSRAIAASYSIGLNLLTVVVETPKEACIKYEYMKFLSDFGAAMAAVPGVLSVTSVAEQAKRINAGWNEGNLKWRTLPRNQFALVQATSPIPSSSGLLNTDCTVLPLMIFTEDATAETLTRIVGAVKDWRADHEPRLPDVSIRLASGNVGVIAATNEEIEASEVPMMVAVYAVIILMVFGTYRDWRATLACCLPLTIATFLGYWFMKELEIGLKVATLPVMVLAVGLGVDYAFYIYNRIQHHLSLGLNITHAYQQTLQETGMAVVFVALTMALGVLTWVLSALKFQADMGLLLFFMFMANMIMAVTALPALAVVLDLLVPRRGPVPTPKHGH